MLMMGGIHFKTLAADNGIWVFHDTDKEKEIRLSQCITIMLNILDKVLGLIWAWITEAFCNFNVPQNSLEISRPWHLIYSVGYLKNPDHYINETPEMW